MDRLAKEAVTQLNLVNVSGPIVLLVQVDERARLSLRQVAKADLHDRLRRQIWQREGGFVLGRVGEHESGLIEDREENGITAHAEGRLWLGVEPDPLGRGARLGKKLHEGLVHLGSHVTVLRDHVAILVWVGLKMVQLSSVSARRTDKRPLV